MTELKSFLFRAYIRAYLSSGESFDLAERAQKHLLNLLTPLTSEIGLNVTSEIFDQYEDEIHEMKGIRQPIVSLHFEAHARTIDQLVDYNLFLRSLARLMDDQSVINICIALSISSTVLFTVMEIMLLSIVAVMSV